LVARSILYYHIYIVVVTKGFKDFISILLRFYSTLSIYSYKLSTPRAISISALILSIIYNIFYCIFILSLSLPIS